MRFQGNAESGFGFKVAHRVQRSLEPKLSKEEGMGVRDQGLGRPKPGAERQAISDNAVFGS